HMNYSVNFVNMEIKRRDCMSQILYEVNEHITELTIQSPPANALSSALINDLEDRLNMIEQDATIKTVVIKGDGRFFSTGADIKEFTSLQKEADYRSLAEKGQQLFDRMEHLNVP